MSRRSCAPETVTRHWRILLVGPTGLGPILAFYRGSENELLEWLPPGPYAWEWV